MDGQESHPQKELLSKVRELNKKIEDLQKGGGGHTVSLDFADSENIVEIESGIKDTMDGIILSKAALCKALANIDKKRLYEQVGAHNFLDYLEMARIPLNYKTAKEYAKIGDTMIRYDKELTTVNFQEEDGLKKLVYLDKALDRLPDDPEAVFQKVKDASLRDFQHWIKDLEGQDLSAGEEPGMEGTRENAAGHLTVDQTGRPIFDFSIEDNVIYRSDGPERKQAVIITKPELLQIDPGGREWQDLLQVLAEMLKKIV